MATLLPSQNVGPGGPAWAVFTKIFRQRCPLGDFGDFLKGFSIDCPTGESSNSFLSLPSQSLLFSQKAPRSPRRGGPRKPRLRFPSFGAHRRLYKLRSPPSQAAPSHNPKTKKKPSAPQEGPRGCNVPRLVNYEIFPLTAKAVKTRPFFFFMSEKFQGVPPLCPF